MLRNIIVILFTASLTAPIASAEPVLPVTSQPQDTLACEIVRERKDWHEAARKSEMRWGLPIEHQFALLAEDWGLEYEKIPARWRPDWTRADRNTPGIPAGYFQSTWKQYTHQSGHKQSSPNSAEDVFGFMGWYFAVLGPGENISPYDPVAQYILWRHGPDVYRAGYWQGNLWMRSQAEEYAARVRLFSDDMQDCSQDRPGLVTYIENALTFTDRERSPTAEETGVSGKPGYPPSRPVSAR